IWTDDDIWDYIHRFSVPYSALYDMQYFTPNGEVCKIKRNACVGCATDIAFADNHLAALRQTHPILWKGYMLKTGLGDEIMKLRAVKKGSALSRLDFFTCAIQVSMFGGCAFDNLDLQQDEITQSEYESEELD
ncbi:MAG: hypothetical protein RSC44_04965, partial [Clostridia bacterium]